MECHPPPYGQAGGPPPIYPQNYAGNIPPAYPQSNNGGTPPVYPNQPGYPQDPTPLKIQQACFRHCIRNRRLDHCIDRRVVGAAEQQ